MGLFDQPLEYICEYIDSKYADGLAREYNSVPFVPLEEEPQIILSEDTGIELGKPGVASRSLILWGAGEKVSDGRITLIGPDFSEASSSSLPFAQVIMVGGRFSDEYDCYRDLRDAIYGLRLKGYMVRVFPRRHSIWCRISREALSSGFSAELLGGSLIQTVKGLSFVDAAEVLLVTSSKEDVEGLAPASNLVLDIVEALAKMYEELNFDCASCEYADVCNNVSELRRIRNRLQASLEEKG